MNVRPMRDTTSVWRDMKTKIHFEVLSFVFSFMSCQALVTVGMEHWIYVIAIGYIMY